MSLSLPVSLVRMAKSLEALEPHSGNLAVQSLNRVGVLERYLHL
jgi:hypothetical protein